MNVNFAPGVAGGAGPPGAPPAVPGGALPPLPAGGGAPPAAVGNNPAVGANTTPWEDLLKFDDMPDTSVAKALADKYRNVPWQEVVAPFAMTYPNDEGTKNMLCHAPAAKYVLAVTAAGNVQLVYGIRFCHATAGQGQRVLALMGERSIMAGMERPPSLVSLHGNLGNQNQFFGASTIRAMPFGDMVTAIGADPNLALFDPLAADPNDAAANPEITTRKALVIHPLLGLFFLQPQPPRDALLLVQTIQEALPVPFRPNLNPLLQFAQLAVTAAVAGGDESALSTGWSRFDHGQSPELETWYFELLQGVRVAPRYTPAISSLLPYRPGVLIALLGIVNLPACRASSLGN